MHGSPHNHSQGELEALLHARLLLLQRRRPRARGPPSRQAREPDNKQTSPPARTGRHAGGHRPIYLRAHLELERRSTSACARVCVCMYACRGVLRWRRRFPILRFRRVAFYRRRRHDVVLGWRRGGKRSEIFVPIPLPEHVIRTS